MNVVDRIDRILSQARADIRKALAQEGIPFEEFESSNDTMVLQYEVGDHGEVYNVVAQQDLDDA